jgi:hypothetical protein
VSDLTPPDAIARLMQERAKRIADDVGADVPPPPPYALSARLFRELLEAWTEGYAARDPEPFRAAEIADAKIARRRLDYLEIRIDTLQAQVAESAALLARTLETIKR